MNKTEPKTLSGFMELYPSEQLVFDKIKNTIIDTYKSYGFYPLDTPVIELSEVLLAKAGGETEKQIYRFDKTKEKVISFARQIYNKLFG